MEWRSDMKITSIISNLCGRGCAATGGRKALNRPHAGPVWVLLALAFTLLSLKPVVGSPSGSELPGLRSYLVQMHLHGHSNHNGNDLPASMESQCYEASKHGFDVVWWTDHEFLFEGFKEDIVVDFSDAAFDADSTTLVFRERSARSLTRLGFDRPPDGTRLNVADGRLKIGVESEPGDRRPNRLTLALASERGRVTLINFCRPVTSGLKLMGRGRVRGLGEDTSVRIYCDFSWHPGGRHHAVFDLVRAPRGGLEVIGDTTVVQQIGIAGEDLKLALDLESALAPLTNGDDNTLGSCRIEIAARNGGAIEVVIDSLKIASTRPQGENQYKTVQKLVRRYEEAYGIKQYVGVEVGLLHRPTMPHMNAYLPRDKATYENTRVRDDMRRDEWIRKIKDAGGIVCVDHPFGAALRRRYIEGGGLPQGLSLRELSLKEGLVDEAQFWRVAGPILDGAWGADLLEVGYLFRGSGSLEDHLRLWDLALANGVSLVGFGSSDSHGGRWGPDMEPNPFASWIWSRTDEPDDLLRAMRSGHIVFGDPFLWKSHLAFGVDDALMGDTLFVGSGRDTEGWVHMEPWRGDVQVRLIQVEIRDSKDLNVIRQDIIENTRDGFSIRVDRPCFARLEVYDKSGVPLAFTNPVYLIPR